MTITKTRARAILTKTRDAARTVEDYAAAGRVEDAARLAWSAHLATGPLRDSCAPSILPYAYAATDAVEDARRAVLAARRAAA